MGYPVSKVCCWASGQVATDGTGSCLKAVTTARTGAGVYTYTLFYPIDATERQLVTTARTATLFLSTYADTSDTVITATYATSAANVATDCAHTFMVWRISNVA